MSRDKITVHLLLVTDICLSITAVALFSTAYAGDLRIQLWENGGAEGWNSDPKQRVYYYANYREPPEIPLIWSQRYAEAVWLCGVLTFWFSELTPCDLQAFRWQPWSRPSCAALRTGAHRHVCFRPNDSSFLEHLRLHLDTGMAEQCGCPGFWRRHRPRASECPPVVPDA